MNSIKRIVVVFSPTSTRSRSYGRLRPQIVDQAHARGWNFFEIRLSGTPYFKARQLIELQLRGGDLLLAAGGDGTAQVSFDAIYSSKKDVVFATVPLGNGNDLSHAINKTHRAVRSILNQSIINFYPLNIIIDNKCEISLATYVTFGATTVLVDYLNRESARARRRLLRSLTPAASIPIQKINAISEEISQLDFPDFERDDQMITDDSIGFFVIPAAHNILRLPKPTFKLESQFFFHHAMTKDKNLVKKVLMAGQWIVNFPGEMTSMEVLSFIDNKRDITANIAGDNTNLGAVKKIGAIRSQRSVKVLFYDK